MESNLDINNLNHLLEIRSQFRPNLTKAVDRKLKTSKRARVPNLSPNIVAALARGFNGLLYQILCLHSFC